MHSALNCPEHEMLRAFADGRLAETDAEGVATHLSDCPVCSAICDRLFAPIYAGFRATISIATPEPEADLLDQVLPRIKGLARLPSQVATATPDQSGSETGPSPAADAAHTLAELIAHLPPPREPGDLARIGPYRLRSVLGQGGMGAVFAAEDADLRRMVAVKIILDPSGGGGTARQRARFLKEARAIAALDHDHIVPIYHAGEDSGVVYLVMPLLRGESLFARLRREPRLPIGLLGRFGSQIAEGLAAAHAAEIVHRDLKPSNVWLEERAGGIRVRLLDFGLAKSLNRDDEFTASHGPMGTPGYMAPEQINGVTATPRTDLFSLGVVLYEMATGTRPFTGKSLREVWDETCAKEPPTPSEISPSIPSGLSDLIHGLLRKDAAAREPEDAGAVANALRQFEDDNAGVFDSAVAMAPPRRRTRSWMIAGSVASMIVLIAAQVVIRVRKEGEPSATELAVPAGTKVTIGGDGVVDVVIPKAQVQKIGPADEGAARPPDLPQPWETLFDGNGFEKWNCLEGSTWSIAERSIVSNNKTSRSTMPLLSLEKDYFNTHLKFKAMVSGNLYLKVSPRWHRLHDARIFSYAAMFPSRDVRGVRTIKVSKLGGGDSGQSQEGDGNSYRDLPQLLLEPGRWHSIEIVTQGRRITTIVDGHAVGVYQDPGPQIPRGRIALWAANGAEGAISFRDISVRRLPDRPDEAWPQLDLSRAADMSIGSDWKVLGDELYSGANRLKGRSLLGFGDYGWQDYDMSVDARQDDVHGGVLGVLVRGTWLTIGKSPTAMLRFTNAGSTLSLGDADGKTSAVKQAPAAKLAVQGVGTGGWVTITIRVRGDRYTAFLNGVEIATGNTTARGGYVGLMSEGSMARFRNIRVIDPAGRVIWQGLPQLVMSLPEPAVKQ